MIERCLFCGQVIPGKFRKNIDDEGILADISEVLRKHNKIVGGMSDSEAVAMIVRILARKSEDPSEGNEDD